MHIIDALREHHPFISFEFYPPKKREEWPAFFATAQKIAVWKPLFVSVTYGAGGSTQENTLEICKRLIDLCGFTVMPHLTGVLATKEKVAAFLDEIIAMGVQNVMALRGDRPIGYTGSDATLFATFRHASDLIRYIREYAPGLTIGAAAFLEAHPEAPSFASDLGIMRGKFASGASFAVSQLFFDSRCYFDYVSRLRLMGVEQPIIPGVMPVRSFSSLRRTLRLCNARIPGQLLDDIFQAEAKGPEAVFEVSAAYIRKLVRELLDNGAPGVHLYTLNHAGLCAKILDGLL